MPRLLFDLISLQGYHNGGEEYTRTVLERLLEESALEIIGLYDSRQQFLDNDFDVFSQKMKIYDIRKNKISDIIAQESINLFFIGIGQRYLYYDLSGIDCKVICVIHDLGDFEIISNDIYKLFPSRVKFTERIKTSVKKFILKRNKYKDLLSRYQRLIALCNQDNVDVITVSQYSRNSISFYLGLNKYIKVLYPPIKKEIIVNKSIEKTFLRNIEKYKPYFLCLNAGLSTKNFRIVKDAFHRFRLVHPHYNLLVTRLPKDSPIQGIYSLNNVNYSQLEELYKQAEALIYPSLTEGFGYPPSDAMKHGTPVIASNVTSIPEVVGEGAIMFSPFYESDLFLKMTYLIENRNHWCMRAKKRYSILSSQQISDFSTLISIITSACDT